MTPIVDSEDQWLLEQHSWEEQVTKTGAIYFKARMGGDNVYLHRLISGAAADELADHKDGNTLDCRRSNLRTCNRSQSNTNRRARKDSRSPFKGITQTPSGRWLAQIMKDKRYYRVGLFDAPESAAEAYDRAAVELHGAFARTNGFVIYECSNAA